MSRGKRTPTVEIDVVERFGEHVVTVRTASNQDFYDMNARGWPIENGGIFPTRQLAETEASRIAATVEQYKGTADRRWLANR